MTSEDPDGIRLTVRGAEKRDAGRGVARLTEAARRELGLLSGDAVVVEGERATVAKVWPARSGRRDDVVRIDADTRSNAGVTIGDTVTVRPETVDSAERVSVEPPRTLAGAERELLQRAVRRHVRGRPVSEGERFTIERVTDEAFHVRTTTPDGPVRVTEDTVVSVLPPAGATGSDSAGHGGSGADGSAGAGGASAGGGSSGAGASGGAGTSAGDAGTGHSGSADAGSDPDVDASDDAIEFRAQSDERGTVSYEDIGGLDEELEQVREMIELPLKQPELFSRLGVDPPKGVLLYGPPGTGKTLIAKAVANEVDAAFYSIDGPEIVSKYKGQSEEQLRQLFETARENAPAVIFFDEIDSVASKRDDDGGLESRVVAQLLSLMDGLDARQDVVVIGATNRIDVIDPALRRGGRFDREIEIGVPDEHGRREILDVHTRNMPFAEDVSLDSLASRTHGFVGADVDALVTEAAMYALRRGREDEDVEADDVDVSKADFDRALAAVEPSGMREFVAETPTTGYEDVGGLEDAKQVLRETVEWPLSYDRLFTETATEPPSGVLLYGPPGTGKTLLARALAGETDVNFVHVDGPELIDKYVGESEKALREVFDRARQGAPSIVFFDEIDALVGRRGEGSTDATDRVVSQLLTELDGLRENPNLVVLAATNRKQDIDPALLRPGRIDTHVEVSVPGPDGREKILEVHTRGKPLADDVDLGELAAELTDYTGADLEAIGREASMIAIREFAEEHGPATADERADEIEIAREHVDRAIESVDRTLEDYPQFLTGGEGEDED